MRDAKQGTTSAKASQKMGLNPTLKRSSGIDVITA